MNGDIRYSILDPSGNITALAEGPVPADLQPAAAAELMRRHPEVEQVGFVCFPEDPDGPVGAELRMAGGEFCGNASACAAVLWFLKTGSEHKAAEAKVRLRVSGTSLPVDVSLRREGDGVFGTCLDHPRARSILKKQLSFGNICETLPVVCPEGISHVIIETGSAFWGLQEDPAAAEIVTRAWCSELSADSLGLMFLSKTEGEYRLTPFVYVPGSGTFFRENSCGSGSASVGMYLASESGEAVSLKLLQPGGSLQVSSDPLSGHTFLSGKVRFLSSHRLSHRDLFS